MNISIYDVMCAANYYETDGLGNRYLLGVYYTMLVDDEQSLTQDDFVKAYGTTALDFLLNNRSN